MLSDAHTHLCHSCFRHLGTTVNTGITYTPYRMHRYIHPDCYLRADYLGAECEQMSSLQSAVHVGPQAGSFDGQASRLHRLFHNMHGWGHTFCSCSHVGKQFNEAVVDLDVAMDLLKVFTVATIDTYTFEPCLDT